MVNQEPACSFSGTHHRRLSWGPLTAAVIPIPRRTHGLRGWIPATVGMIGMRGSGAVAVIGTEARRRFRGDRFKAVPESTHARSENGEGGIRTHGDPEATPVFKTGAFNRSATSPGPAFAGVDMVTDGSTRNGRRLGTGASRTFRLGLMKWATTPQAVGVVDPVAIACRWGRRSPSSWDPPKRALDVESRRRPFSYASSPGRFEVGRIFGPAKAQSRRSERTS